jgi:hypothetical protein
MNFPFSKIGINFYFVLMEMCFYRAVFQKIIKFYDFLEKNLVFLPSVFDFF